MRERLLRRSCSSCSSRHTRRWNRYAERRRQVDRGHRAVDRCTRVGRCGHTPGLSVRVFGARHAMAVRECPVRKKEFWVFRRSSGRFSSPEQREPAWILPFRDPALSMSFGWHRRTGIYAQLSRHRRLAVAIGGHRWFHCLAWPAINEAAQGHGTTDAHRCTPMDRAARRSVGNPLNFEAWLTEIKQQADTKTCRLQVS